MKAKSTTAQTEVKASINPEGPEHHRRMRALCKTGNFLVRPRDFFAVKTVEAVRNSEGGLIQVVSLHDLRAKKEKSSKVQG